MTKLKILCQPAWPMRGLGPSVHREAPTLPSYLLQTMAGIPLPEHLFTCNAALILSSSSMTGPSSCSAARAALTMHPYLKHPHPPRIPYTRACTAAPWSCRQAGLPVSAPPLRGAPLDPITVPPVSKPLGLCPHLKSSLPETAVRSSGTGPHVPLVLPSRSHQV